MKKRFFTAVLAVATLFGSVSVSGEQLWFQDVFQTFIRNNPDLSEAYMNYEVWANRKSFYDNYANYKDKGIVFPLPVILYRESNFNNAVAFRDIIFEYADCEDYDKLKSALENTEGYPVYEVVPVYDVEEYKDITVAYIEAMDNTENVGSYFYTNEDEFMPYCFANAELKNKIAVNTDFDEEKTVNSILSYINGESDKIEVMQGLELYARLCVALSEYSKSNGMKAFLRDVDSVRVYIAYQEEINPKLGNAAQNIFNN